jgi:hypothetical protein
MFMHDSYYFIHQCLRSLVPETNLECCIREAGETENGSPTYSSIKLNTSAANSLHSSVN